MANVDGASPAAAEVCIGSPQPQRISGTAQNLVQNHMHVMSAEAHRNAVSARRILVY
jgi:hypothetical protein